MTRRPLASLVALSACVAASASSGAQARGAPIGALERAATLMPAIADAVLAPQKACQDAIAAAEKAYAIPPGFLLAIARVESGRPEPRTGLTQPWPWTTDTAGKGAFFATRSEAVASVEAAQQAGTQSIDVGCMQVNLQQHPAAFASLDEAFDPRANALYAARFLTDLRRESGDWMTASGLYHSRTEALATPYREAVAARLAGGSALASALALGPVLPPIPPPRPLARLAAAWAATLDPDQASGAPMRLWPKPPVRAMQAPSATQRAALRLSSRQ